MTLSQDGGAPPNEAVADAVSLMSVYSGWDGYQTSLVRAIAPLSAAQLAYRLTPVMRSVGEIAGHIAFGRIDWFNRMGAPGSTELATQIAALPHAGAAVENAIAADAAAIVHWLQAGWHMIETNLTQWTVADLAQTYLQPYRGHTYAVSRQWTIWRILAHDIHHGGQLTVLLNAQGIAVADLGDQGGHIIAPPRVEAV